MCLWKKPHGDDLLPVFMQETTGLVKTAGLLWGTPALSAYLLMRHDGRPWAVFGDYYAGVLSTVFGPLGIFYVFHLMPALLVRFLIGGEKGLSPMRALFLAVFLDFLALLLVYPPEVLLNPATLFNILFYAALAPTMTAFFTLRITRLRFSGVAAIVVFVVFLCRGMF